MTALGLTEALFFERQGAPCQSWLSSLGREHACIYPYEARESYGSWWWLLMWYRARAGAVPGLERPGAAPVGPVLFVGGGELQ